LPEGANLGAHSVGILSRTGERSQNTLAAMEVESDLERAAPEAPVHVEEKGSSLDEAHRQVGWSLSALFAPPTPPAGPATLAMAGPSPALSAPTLRNVQRLAGNRATVAVMERIRDRFGVQRDPEEGEGGAAPAADVSVTGLALSADAVTLPLADALSATAAPDNATGVVYSVAAGTANTDNVAIDETTGVITIAAGQQGGRIEVSADAADESGVTVDLDIMERPGTISATATSGTEDYGGAFTHTFTAPSGRASGLEGANINEEFDASSAATPWGNTFNLDANAAGSHGWDLDSAGKMTGPDDVTIGTDGVNIGKLYNSTSNPEATKALPQGFTMTQSLYAMVQPGGTREASAFATVSHRREVIEGPQFRVTAGLGSITEDYSGPAAVTNAAASSSTVMASAPRPESGEWTQRKVTVSADAIPDTATLAYSITGRALGCTIDSDGEVSIGARAGTITVRVTASTANYDEVTIAITRYVAPEESESASATEPAPESSGPGEEAAAPGPATEPAPAAPVVSAPVGETGTAG